MGSADLVAVFDSGEPDEHEPNGRGVQSRVNLILALNPAPGPPCPMWPRVLLMWGRVLTLRNQRPHLHALCIRKKVMSGDVR